MKLKRRIRARLSAALSAALALVMAAPALPAYAENPVGHGEAAELRFDPDIGPDLQNSLNGYGEMRKEELEGRNISVARGKAGELLTTGDFPAAIPTEHVNGDGNTDLRPELPKFDPGLWTGYRFEGWFNAAGERLSYLPPAFPYRDQTVYTARWIPDKGQKFTFTLMHYRDRNDERNGRTDGAAWPEENDAEIIAFQPIGTSRERKVGVGETIYEDRLTSIPGYEFQDALIKNNKKRRYSDPSGAGTIEEGKVVLTPGKPLSGAMPNDDLTVAYRYRPNPEVKFPLTAEYYGENNVPIRAAETRLLSAESEFRLSPEGKVGTFYRLRGAKFIAGNVANPGSCIYAFDASGFQHDTGVISGRMPNQGVTVRYLYELDPDALPEVQLHFADGEGRTPAGLEEAKAHQTIAMRFEHREIPIPKLKGYLYPPLIRATPSANFRNWSNPTEANPKLGFTLEKGGGEISVVYTEDLSDASSWTRVTYESAENGRITGLTSPRLLKNGEHPLEGAPAALTAGIVAEADPHYEFDGWYKADPGGKRTGERLSGEITLSGGDMRLVAAFRKNPNDWFRLSFRPGRHGKIRGQLSAEALRGSAWRELTLPEASPDKGYRFEGWFNEAGARMEDDPDAALLAPQIFTARFQKIAGGGDDHMLTIPDAEGSVRRDGSGEVRVNAANERRNYALTDADGTVIAVKSGLSLSYGDSFEGLAVCSEYRVYELADGERPAPGSDIRRVDPNRRSQPASAPVPALGENYAVSDDAGGTVKLTVKPAAKDTVYALVDADGKVVEAPGASDGFRTPSGSPLTVEFSGLTPNRIYTVVARPASGQETAEEKLPMGSTLTLSASSGELYTLTILNISGEKVVKKAKAGERVKLDAPAFDGENRRFLRWETVAGDLRVSPAERRSPTVVMPAGDAVLRALYEESPASPSNVTLDYAPKDGRFAFDPEDEDGIEALRLALSDNPEDRAVLAVPETELAYTVHFYRGSVPASTSDALREQTGEERQKLPWRVEIGLKRAVDGVNRPVSATPGNAFRAVASLSRSLRGNMDYRLFKEGRDAAGEAVFTELPLSPDPDGEDFGGLLGFSAQIGDRLILSYVRGYSVEVIDTKRGGEPYRLRVKEGDAISEADGYAEMMRELSSDYTDPRTGIVYEFDGLRRKNSPTAKEWGPESEVRRGLTLYALYREADDSAWRAAKKKLEEEINLAHALSEDGGVSPEDREKLRGAVAEAIELRDRLPRPSVGELEAAYERLKEMTDGVRKGGGAVIPPVVPGRPEEPKKPEAPEKPAGPERPSPGGSGGGGGRSGASSGRRGGPGTAYQSGMDGNWDNFDPENHGWAFVLRSGERLRGRFADIAYSYGGETRVYSYHFDSEGVMDSGWYRDEDGSWYFLSTVHDGWFGSLQKGWHRDGEDGRWYYLSLLNGAMQTGWQRVDGRWYYFNPQAPEQTWFRSGTKGGWEYRGSSARPLGSMYAGETTPDGYPVGEDGAWVRETP